MPAPVLPIVVGTRCELLAAASTVEAFRAADPLSLPFVPRLLSTGQEATELDQTFDALSIAPDADLGVKAPHLADAALGARLVQAMESALRHQDAAAVMAVGSSHSAWATAVAAYHKQIPLIHLGAGDFAPEPERPWPEWLHRLTLAHVAQLHLCRDEVCARALARMAGEGASVRVVGDGADEVLARSLASAPETEDPTLAGLRPGAPRVLLFIRRREHHANALRPLCQALEPLSAEFSGHEFVAVHSLQSHICDALVALLPRRANVLGVSPFPHSSFVREVARARLVITDSAGLAREAALLGRPVVTIGAYSTTESLCDLFAAGSVASGVCAMGIEPIRETVAGMLTLPDPAPAPARIEIPSPGPGRRAMEEVVAWWKESRIGE